MKKNQKARKKEVLNLLKKQKIRSIEQTDAYKLSPCHPHSAGIDLGSTENYVALNPEIAAERDPKKLASLRDGRCKHTEEEIEEAMTGIYKDDQLVALRVNHNIWRGLQAQIDELDLEIGRLLQTFKDAPEREKAPKDDAPQEGQAAGNAEGTENGKKKEKKKRKTKASKNDIKAGIDLEKELLRICGADLTSLTGIQANAALQVVAEVGTDLSAFPTKEDFTSFLGFSPHNKITGGRLISAKTDRKKSYAAQAFKKVIPSIIKGKSSLSAFYHRINGKKGTAVAITATCRKLAERYYDVVTKGEDYIEYGEELYQQKIKERELKYLKKLAKKQNLEIKEAV